MKTCARCKRESPATLEYFYKRERGYLKSACKSCDIKSNLLWTQNNREKSRAKTARWRSNNLEKLKESNKKSKAKRIDQIRVERRAWDKGPGRDYGREKNRRRRAKKVGNGFEKYTDAQVLELYGTNCYLCDMPIDLNAPRSPGTPGWRSGLHIEHFIDIALGGPDTLENVRPSHGWCNLTKAPNLDPIKSEKSEVEK